MERQSRHVVIIGAGIAGMSAASALLRDEKTRVTLLEKEDAPFSLASGMNAAIFRPLETDPLLAQLAGESLAILQKLEAAHGVSLLKKSGLLMLDCNESKLEKMEFNAHNNGTHATPLDSQALKSSFPYLTLNESTAGLYSKMGGVLDPHGIGQALLRQVQQLGAVLKVRAPVARLVIDGLGQCRGVTLKSGTTIHCDAVVLCAGAANGPLTYDIAAPLPLLPLQRHLVILEPERPIDPKTSVIWHLEPELYFRPESGGVLASPCDETPRQDGLAQAHIEALEPLAARFESIYPGLFNAKVRRYWACIRTKSPDTRPIIGSAKTVPGLYYLAGLAGFGMSCGLACGAWLARSIQNESIAPEVDPARFYLPFLEGASSPSLKSNCYTFTRSTNSNESTATRPSK